MKIANIKEDGKDEEKLKYHAVLLVCQLFLAVRLLAKKHLNKCLVFDKIEETITNRLKKADALRRSILKKRLRESWCKYFKNG